MATWPSWLAQLSHQQQRAVSHCGGPLVVIAGAGSGKTRTLVYRAAWLIHHGTAPSSIVVATFTNKAANEFSSRLAQILGTQSGQLHAGTLHSIGARILRRYWRRDFKIYDARDSRRVLREAIRDAGMSTEDPVPIDYIANQISNWKERLVDPEGARKEVEQDEYAGSIEELTAVAYEKYEELLARIGALDFDDLIGKTVKLLEGSPGLLSKMKVEHILVDEFQDINHAQLRMIQAMRGKSGVVWAVGDPDQAIYGWRGADPKIILQFEQHFPGAERVFLGQNFRSTQIIVRGAAAVIQNNKSRFGDQRLWSDNEVGVPIVDMNCQDEQAEAYAVTRQIRALHDQLQIPWREIAILYRTNRQSRPFEEALLQAGIPYHVPGVPFFLRPEVRSVVAYLRVAIAPDDIAAVEEIYNLPPRGITPATWQAVLQELRIRGGTLLDLLAEAETIPVTKQGQKGLMKLRKTIVDLNRHAELLDARHLVEYILHGIRIQAYWNDRETRGVVASGTSPTENLKEVAALVMEKFDGPAMETIPEFLNYASLLGAEYDDSVVDCVRLLTIHAAKGLEFRAVFLVGCEEGLLPHWHAAQSGSVESIEEERRLFYVGMTRAKELLYLCRAFRRMTDSGSILTVTPSRFLMEIPMHLRTWWKAPLPTS